MSTPGRNEPCPCGSGHKYKRCCLPKQAVSPAKIAAEQRGIEDGLVGRLSDFTQRTCPGALDAVAELMWYDQPQQVTMMLIPALVMYCPLDDAGPCPAALFLDERGKYLTDRERSFLAAQLRAHLSIWEVLEVERGVGLRLRDRLALTETFVHEKLGSATLSPRDVLLGRVVEHDGVATIFGMYGRPLPPAAAHAVEAEVRTLARKKVAALELAVLTKPKTVWTLVDVWQETLAHLDNRPPPTVVTTDGDELLSTRDRFHFASRDREALLAKLETCDDVRTSETDDDAEPGVQYLHFWKAGNAVHKSWDNTIIGHLEIHADQLYLDTKSLPRADLLRQRLLSLGIKSLQHRLRSHSDPLSSAHDPRLAPTAQEPPPEVLEMILKMQHEHYDTWPDLPVPALQGKTPRAAVGTAAGRRDVDLLLRQMEHSAQRTPQTQRYDFAKLCTNLGL